MSLLRNLDDTSHENDLLDLKKKNDSFIDKLISDMNDAFDKDDENRAKQLTAMLQYHSRIDETILEKMFNIPK